MAAEADVRGFDHDYLALVRRHVMLVVGAVVLAAGAAGAASLLQPTVYQATAEVLLETRVIDPVTGTPVNVDPARVMQTEVQVAMSRQVGDLVKKKLRKAPDVTAVPAGQSDVLKINATAGSAQGAAEIANAYADSYIEFRRNRTRAELIRNREAVVGQLRGLERQTARARGVQRQQLIAEQSLLRQRRDALTAQLLVATGGASILNAAVPPDVPISPNPLRNLLLGGIAGLVLGLAVALLADRRRYRPIDELPPTSAVALVSSPQAGDAAYVEHPNRATRWVDGRAVPDRSTDEADVTVWFRLDPHHADPPAWEGLLSRMGVGDRAVVLAVPVFASDVNFGDEVRVVPAPSGSLVSAEVTVPGNNCTFRVQFSQWIEPTDDPRRIALMTRLGALGCVFDEFTPRLMAVSARVDDAQDVIDVLEDAQTRGEVLFAAARGGRRRRTGSAEIPEGPVPSTRK